jgi:predicted ATPase
MRERGRRPVSDNVDQQSNETSGTVSRRFGDMVALPVDVGDTHIADAARRCAVALDDGGLMFL